MRLLVSSYPNVLVYADNPLRVGRKRLSIFRK
nr:MAG TPA: hypothetical protein [Caudoviricetes sp.]